MNAAATGCAVVFGACRKPQTLPSKPQTLQVTAAGCWCMQPGLLDCTLSVKDSQSPHFMIVGIQALSSQPVCQPVGRLLLRPRYHYLPNTNHGACMCCKSRRPGCMHQQSSVTGPCVCQTDLFRQSGRSCAESQVAFVRTVRQVLWRESGSHILGCFVMLAPSPI
jgi:hypothetical protein